MKVVDCYWELDNIQKSTVELSFNLTDRFNELEVKNNMEGYQYVVAKVECGNIDCLYGLQNMGFTLMETQIGYSLKYKDFRFEDRLLKLISKKLQFTTINDEVGLNRVLDSMTENMFTTDRVYLDPQLGPALGLHRYRNWVTSEYNRGTTLIEACIEDVPIGFSLFKIKDGICHGLLGGLYEKFQDAGYGLLTTAFGFMYCRENNIKIKRGKTACSSNNLPILQFYNYLNFKIDSLHYVLVKHQ